MVAQLEINSWAQFKLICLADKKLDLQYTEDDASYEIYAQDSMVWHIIIAKGSADATDFENNYKTGANQLAVQHVRLVDVSKVPIDINNPLPTRPHDNLGHAVGFIEDDTIYRMQVQASLKPGSSVSVSPIPTNPGCWVRDFVRNGGSKELNVDGSVTPVVFTFPANADHDIALSEIRFILNCSSLNMKSDDFGADIALTNGVKLEITSDGVTTELANLCINEDLLALPGAANIIYDGPSNDQIIASFALGGAVKLLQGTADNVKVTVRDDLTFASAHKVVLFWVAVSGVRDA